MAYPIPGYLEHPADLAGNMLAGFQAGAGVAKAQAQLQQEAQQTGLRMAVQERQMQMDQIRQQQQMEMQRQFHDAQLGLRKQQLETAQQRIQLATQQAAQKFTAQQNVQRRTQELSAGGLPLEQATRQAFLENASMLGLSGAGVADLTKPATQKPVWVRPDPTTGAPGHFETPQGSVHIPARVSEPGQIGQRDILSYWRQREKEAAASAYAKMTVTKDTSPEMRKQIEQAKADLQEAKTKIQRLIPPEGLKGLPLPKEKKDLQKGQLYQTRRGTARWDGEQFHMEQPYGDESDSEF